MTMYEIKIDSLSYEDFEKEDRILTENEVIVWADEVCKEYNRFSNRIITINGDIDKALRLLKNAGEYLIEIKQ